MSTHKHSINAPLALALLGAMVVTAVSFVIEVAPGQDVSFPAFMLGGPLLTGVVLSGRGRWRVGAAAWSIAALVWLVLDWAINHEDVAFHAAVSVIFAALVTLGAGLASISRRRRARRTSGTST